MTTTLVTGAAGFIGSHVARRLAERGDELRLGVLRGAPEEALQGVEDKRVSCDVTAAAPCAGRCVASTASSTAPGSPRFIPATRSGCSRSTSSARGPCSRSACARRWSAWS